MLAGQDDSAPVDGMNAMSGDHRAPFIVEYSEGKRSRECKPDGNSVTESVNDDEEEDSLNDIDLSEVGDQAESHDNGDEEEKLNQM